MSQNTNFRLSLSTKMLLFANQQILYMNTTMQYITTHFSLSIRNQPFRVITNQKFNNKANHKADKYLQKLRYQSSSYPFKCFHIKCYPPFGMQDMNKVPEFQDQRAIQQICTDQQIIDYTCIILPKTMPRALQLSDIAWSSI